VLTIPCSIISSAERSFSALKRIKTYLCSNQIQERLCDLSILLIEQEMLQTVKKQADFYDDIIENFALQERRLDLLFKEMFY
jgi:hypothetical protein